MFRNFDDWTYRITLWWHILIFKTELDFNPIRKKEKTLKGASLLDYIYYMNFMIERNLILSQIDFFIFYLRFLAPFFIRQLLKLTPNNETIRYSNVLFLTWIKLSANVKSKTNIWIAINFCATANIFLSYKNYVNSCIQIHSLQPQAVAKKHNVVKYYVILNSFIIWQKF